MNRERTEMKGNRMHGGKLRGDGGNGELEFCHQRLVATTGWGRTCGITCIGSGGMMSAFGNGGQRGTCVTRSRQAWRSFGGICDQRSASFRNCARSAGLKPANLVKAWMHYRRCCTGSLSKDCRGCFICRRSASESVLSDFCFSAGVSSKNWLKRFVNSRRFPAERALQRSWSACQRLLKPP